MFGSAVAGATAGLDLTDTTVVDSTAVFPELLLGTANPEFAKVSLADGTCCLLAALAFALSREICSAVRRLRGCLSFPLPIRTRAA